MKKQIEESIQTVSEIIADGKLDNAATQKLFVVLGTLQGLLILEAIK